MIWKDIIVYGSFLFSCCVHISQYYDLVSSSVELPASEDKDVRTDWSCCVTITTQRRLTLEFTFLPNKLVVCVEDDEVVDVWRWDEILFSSCAWVDRPSTEEDDIGSADVGSVSVSWKRRSSWDSDSGPLEFLCVKDSDIVEVAGLELSTLTEICWFLGLFIERKSSLNYHICADLKSCVSLSFRGNWSLALGLCPCHDFEIKDKKIVEVLFSIGSSKDEDFSLVYKNCRMAVSCWRWTYTFWTL